MFVDQSAAVSLQLFHSVVEGGGGEIIGPGPTPAAPPGGGATVTMVTVFSFSFVGREASPAPSSRFGSA